MRTAAIGSPVAGLIDSTRSPPPASQLPSKAPGFSWPSPSAASVCVVMSLLVSTTISFLRVSERTLAAASVYRHVCLAGPRAAAPARALRLLVRELCRRRDVFRQRGGRGGAARGGGGGRSGPGPAAAAGARGAPATRAQGGGCGT